MMVVMTLECMPCARLWYADREFKAYSMILYVCTYIACAYMVLKTSTFTVEV